MVVLLFINIFLSFSNLAYAQSPNDSGELKTGTWVGSLTYFKPHRSVIAARFDNFLFQPDNSKEFPRMQALLKTSRGGFDTAEYNTNYIQNIDYDFDQNIVTIDSDGTDLVLVGKLYKQPKLNFAGTFSSKSSTASGGFYFEFQDDEPDEGVTSIQPSAQFVSTIGGQYEGTCNDRYLKLQLEPRRDESKKVNLEWPYTFSGRIGMKDDVACSTPEDDSSKQTCLFKSYSRGAFDAHNALMTLSGEQSSDTCRVNNTESLTCDFVIGPVRFQKCLFQKKSSPSNKYHMFPRKFNFQPTPAQRKDIPQVAPPKSAELVRALSGKFTGYLHHENSDRYQAASLYVSATTSTENIHIPNMVSISTNLTLDFVDQPAVSLSYGMSRRSAYFRPGYVLSDANGDAIVLIDEWKSEYISGTLFSKTYGRVGTIQLLKTLTAPPLPKQVNSLGHVVGNYIGPGTGGSGLPVDIWSFSLNAVSQKSSYLIPFPKIFGNGSFNSNLPNFPAQPIAIGDGFYDFFSNNFSFTRDYGREGLFYVNGNKQKDSLFLFWANAPRFGVFLSEYGLIEYRPQSLLKGDL